MVYSFGGCTVTRPRLRTPSPELHVEVRSLTTERYLKQCNGLPMTPLPMPFMPLQWQFQVA